MLPIPLFPWTRPAHGPDQQCYGLAHSIDSSTLLPLLFSLSGLAFQPLTCFTLAFQPRWVWSHMDALCRMHCRLGTRAGGSYVHASGLGLGTIQWMNPCVRPAVGDKEFHALGSRQTVLVRACWLALVNSCPLTRREEGRTLLDSLHSPSRKQTLSTSISLAPLLCCCASRMPCPNQTPPRSRFCQPRNGFAKVSPEGLPRPSWPQDRPIAPKTAQVGSTTAQVDPKTLHLIKFGTDHA